MIERQIIIEYWLHILRHLERGFDCLIRKVLHGEFNFVQFFGEELHDEDKSPLAEEFGN